MISPRVQGVKPSATLQITARAKALRAAGKGVVSLGAGEPDFDTPSHIKEALVKALREKFIYYTPSTGIPELKKAIAEKLETENNIPCTESEVIVTPGAKQALHEAVFAVTDQGDEVICPDPGWVSYEPMVQLAGGKPVFVPAREEDGFAFNIEEVQEKMSDKTRAMIINTPCNPTGAVLAGSILKGMADLCVDHDIIAISDEIYEKIIYEGEHVSMASLPDMKDRTITVNGFSKAYSMTGWRLGYAAGPVEIIRAMTKVQSHSVSCATSFVQKAGVAALTSPQDEVGKMVAEFGRRRDTLMKLLAEIEGVSCVQPMGAFYAFPNFKRYGEDSFELAGYLLEEAGVAMIPGAAFGGNGEGFQRLSYATSMDNIERALERMKKALEKRSVSI
ncbi:MAG: pyridoxal phosphate-dependent aminotransferase [Candidatus Hydrothermarchaeaceae archaeon]